MSANWNDRIPQRPDRYTDWEVQSRQPSPALERWASASIEIFPDSLLDRLKRLQRMVEEGRTLKMSSDERRQLADRISHLVDGSEPDRLFDRQYFIYLPEDAIYDAGQADGYARHPDFQIRYATPPIPGLTVGRTFRANDAIEFPLKEFAAPPVVVAIIDDGLGFANQRFLNSTGTRVVGAWLQDVESPQGDSGVAFGKRLYGDELDSINAKILAGTDELDIYRDSAVDLLNFKKDRHPSMAYRAAHGTHVMDLAAGFDPSENVLDRPILAFQLPPPVTADTSGTKLASYVLQAVRMAILWADRLHPSVPLVINFSYGFTAGPKDGSSLIEQEIDTLVKARNDAGATTVVVVPAGNSYLNRTTACFELDDQTPKTVDWVILPDDLTDNFLEVWIDDDCGIEDGDDGEAPITITLSTPDGTVGPSEMPCAGSMKVLESEQGVIAGIYYDKRTDPPDGDSRRHRFFLAVNPTTRWDADGAETAPSGAWTLTLTNKTKRKLDAWCYIQRDDTPAGYRRAGRQSYFDHELAYERDPLTGDYLKLSQPDATGAACPITHKSTLTAIGNGTQTIVVGGVIDDTDWPPAAYTASGPTPARCGPHLSSVTDAGHQRLGIMASGTRSNSVVAMRGTSTAAPQVARFLADQIAKGNSAATLPQMVAGALAGITNERHEEDGNPSPSQHGSQQTLIPIPPGDPRRGLAVVTQQPFPHIPRRRYPTRQDNNA